MGGLEGWVEGERLVQVSSEAGEEVLVQEDVSRDLFGEVLDGPRVD